MKPKALVVLLLLLFPLYLSAGTRPLRVELPEKAVQGEPVEVRYVFEVSSSWSFMGLEQEVEGLRLVSRNFEEIWLSPSVIQIVITYQVKGVIVGDLELPPVQVLTNAGTKQYPSGTLHFEPHPDYGNAWTEAREFLKRQGEDCRELEWRYTDKGIHAFYDAQRKSFAWVGPDGVVAFGVNAPMWDGKKKIIVGDLFNAYGDGRFVTVPEGAVEPLLGDIAYGQEGIYCEGFPKGSYQGRDSTCVAGCGAVALAQLLRFYGPDVRPSGKGQVTLDGQSPISVDIHKIDWNNLKVNELIYLSAASVRTHLSPVRSTSISLELRHALVGNWGFSPECQFGFDLPLEETVNRVCMDLDAGRPVFLGGHNHVFVCDGYKDGFLHFNFGWDGNCNGWYRLPEGFSIQECLTAMRPMLPEEDYALDVTLKKAGTLASVIPEERCLTVTRLKVSGKIRGEDIALLRRMATEGMLMDLDLADARIVIDGMLFHNYGHANVIGTYMFADCENLLSLRLPKSISGIEDEAFWGCSCLEHLYLPEGMRLLSEKALAGTPPFLEVHSE